MKDKKIIGAKTLIDLYTWIDEAYAVCDNMRGHTGGALSMGYGIMLGKSWFHIFRDGRNRQTCLIQYMVYNAYGCTSICNKKQCNI